jgi:hypothetical protein
MNRFENITRPLKWIMGLLMVALVAGCGGGGQSPILGGGGAAAAAAGAAVCVPTAGTTKAITAFSLAGAAGVVNEAAKTISVVVPSGTNVTALVATFTTNGTSVKVGTVVQTSAVTANNFTNPVTYTVTAGDCTTVNYTVTVTVSTLVAASCTGPGPLDLLTANSFAVLAGTALTVTNPTSITGNVGSPSITPAAGPSTLVGTQYDTSTGSLPLIAAAVTDMQTAAACGVARACDVSYGAAKDFGGSVGLLPGHHCVTGGMSVGSNLTLTNPGVYIFSSTGTLTSAPTVTVAFGGAANASNSSVFWVPTGTTSIGATNTFIGSILANNAAITLGANTTLLPGRTLSGAAVTLSTNTITRPVP